MCLTWLQLYTLIGVLPTLTAYKILVFSPQTVYSHVAFMGNIADVLVEDGHNVTVFVPAINPHVTAVGTKLAKVWRRPGSYGTTTNNTDPMKSYWEEKGTNFLTNLKAMNAFGRKSALFCQSLADDRELHRAMRAESFDLAIVQAFNPCSYGFMELIHARAYITSFATNIIEPFAQSFDIESNPSFVPGFSSPFTDEMTYLERFLNIAMTQLWKVVMEYALILPTDAIFSKALGRKFSFEEGARKSSFVFVNSEEFTEFSRSLNHRIVYIGGIGVPKPKPLDTDFRILMDNASSGAVLVSFGSLAKAHLMPARLKEAFIEAFKSLPGITFIWKYEIDDDIGNGVKNLHKTKWAPQNDLLAHPNLRAFVSHGGMNSVTESTHAGVPMICVPLFFDQLHNARMVEKRGVAYVLDKQNITKESLVQALRIVLYTPSYGQAAKLLANMIKRKPVSARQRLLGHVEFVAQFGQFNNLHSASANLNFMQYYLLDIIVPCFIVLLLTAFTALHFISFFLRISVRKIKVKQH